jgi:hypothetical protein
VYSDGSLLPNAIYKKIKNVIQLFYLILKIVSFPLLILYKKRQRIHEQKRLIPSTVQEIWPP